MASDYVVGLYEGLVLGEAVKAPRGGVKFTNGTGQLRLGSGPSSATAFTFTTWVNITTDTNFYALWLSLQGASSTYIEAGFDITGTGSIVNDLSTERAVGVNFSTNSWYFFAVSMGASGAVTVFTGPEGGKLTKYTTTLTNLTLPLSDKLLGGELSSEPLSGAMAQTRFWNAVLSDAEVIAEFYADAPVRTSNIGGHWKLENTTDKLTDSSGQSNTLTNPQGTGTYAYQAGPAIGPSPFGAPSENVPVSETIDAVYTAGSGGSYTGSVSETVTGSESLGVVDNAIVGVAETDNLSESLGSVRGAIAGLAETVTLSESAGATYAAVVPTPETVNLSEALGTQSNEASALAETVTLSESMSGGSAFTAATSETVTVSESTAAVYAATAATSETVSVGESAGSQAVMGSDLSETVTHSEGGAFTYSAIVAPSETVTNSESVTGIQGGGGGGSYTDNVSETVSLSEALSVVYSPMVASAETVFVATPAMAELPSTDLHLVAEDWTPGTNWVSRVGGFTATLSGTLQKKSAPDIERNEIYGFSTADHFTLPANAAHDFTNSLQATWEFLVRTTATGGILWGWDPYPAPGGYDIAQYALGALIGVVNDPTTDYYRVNAGLISFGAEYSLITFVVDSANDTLSIYVNGTLDQTVTGHTGTLNSSTSGDVFIGNSNGNDQPYDGGIIEILRHRTALTSTQVSERVALVGKNRMQPSRGTSGAPAETVSLSDATAAAYGATPSVADTLSLSDAAALAQTLAQGLPETVSLSESASALAALARAVNETVSLAEALASSIVSTYTLSETVNLAEAVALSQVLTNALAETVALAEAMIGYIPRVLVTELGEPTAVKTATIAASPKLAVETGTPTAVINAVTAIQGAP